MNIATSKPHQLPPPAGQFKSDRTHSRPRLEVVRNAMDAQVGHSFAGESVRTNSNAAATVILFGPFRLLPARAAVAPWRFLSLWSSTMANC